MIQSDLMNRIFPALILLIFTILSCKSEKPKFEKIVFHSSICFGNCDAYHLEIKRDTAVRIYGETVYEHTDKIDYLDDVERQGYFTGKAKSSDFKKLDSIIQNIGIDTLKFADANGSDASVYTIIVYYNNKKVLLKSMNPPEQAYDLIRVLSSICRNSDVRRTYEVFELEEQKKYGY